MAYFTANYNQEFATSNQVFRIGSGEAITPAPGFTVEKFDDPFGGYIYASLDETAAPKRSAATQMVNTANAYKASWDLAKAATNHQSGGLTDAQWEAKTRDAVRSMEMMRGLYAIFGQLHATANWRRISEELWPFVEGAPSTELGEQAATWAAERGR